MYSETQLANRPAHQQGLVIVLDRRIAMDYLDSLYDAPVSINVPNDKARALVDAMERDLGTTIATKSGLQLMR